MQLGDLAAGAFAALAINAALNTPGRDDVALRLALISLAAAITGLVLAEMLQRWARRRLEA